MPKQEKIDFVKDIKKDLSESKAFILTDYRGLTVGEITDLRRKLRESGANYKVVKNTLFKLASEDIRDAALDEMLAGPTAIAFVSEDPISPAKVIVDFAKTHKELSLKGGYFEGQVLNLDQITALSKIPPKEVLVAQLLGSMQSPITSFVGTLQGIVSEFVFTLQAVADEKAA